MKGKYLSLTIPALVLCALFIGISEAHAADEDFVSRPVQEFYNKTSTWEPTLKRYALIVFRWLLILEVCFLGIKAALNRDQFADIFKQVVMLLLMAGFFMAVINYYQEWAWNLINGLGSIGRELTPGGYSSESPFLTGMQLVKLVLDKLSIWSGQLHRVAHRGTGHHHLFRAHFRAGGLHQMRGHGGHGGGAYPGGLRRQLLSQGIRRQRHSLCVLAVAFKLVVMQLVLGVGIAFIEGFSTSTAKLQDIFVVIGASVVLLALVKSLPDVCAGIINGSHVASGAAFTSAVAAAGGGMVGAAVGSTNAIKNIRDAANVAGMEGSSGVDKAAHMAKSLWGARQDAKTAGEKALSTRTRSEMQERLERARMNKNDNS